MPGAVGPGRQRVRPAPLAAQACEQGRTRYVKDTPAAAGTARRPHGVGPGHRQGVVVAVVDTGVADANAHFPDGVLLPGRSFAGGSPRTDPRAHGTAVAGIVAARPLGDRSGVEGLAPQARILPVKVVPDEPGTADGEVAIGALADGIRYAARAGADVVNVSLSTTSDDPRLRAAVRDATRQGALVVASAGNRRTAAGPGRRPALPRRLPRGGGGGRDRRRRPGDRRLGARCARRPRRTGPRRAHGVGGVGRLLPQPGRRVDELRHGLRQRGGRPGRAALPGRRTRPAGSSGSRPRRRASGATPATT